MQRWKIADVRDVITNQQGDVIDGTFIDTTSAQTIVTVFDALNPANQEKAQCFTLAFFGTWCHSQVQAA